MGALEKKFGHASLLAVLVVVLCAAPAVGPTAAAPPWQGAAQEGIARALADRGIVGTQVWMLGDTLIVGYTQPPIVSADEPLSVWLQVLDLAATLQPSAAYVQIQTSFPGVPPTLLRAALRDVQAYRQGQTTIEALLASLEINFQGASEAGEPPLTVPPVTVAPAEAKPGRKPLVKATDTPGAKRPSGGSAGRIAFASNVGGDYEIYTVTADGSGLTRLTNNPGEDWFPAWSPNGEQIAYECTKAGNLELCLMNGDGSNARRLTSYGKTGSVQRPTWSPDGRRIAFSVESSQAPTAIWIVPAGGGKASRLTDGRDPSWSPDGARLAYTEQTGLGGPLAVINVDGSGRQRLTGDETFYRYPTWSPDGTQIAYGVDGQGLYLMKADGSNRRRISRYSSWGLAWSPDGNRLAISDDGSVMVLNRDGSGVRTVAQGIQPSWAP